MTSNNMLNGGQVIIDYLIKEGVPYVFGLCGHGNIGIIDAMYERSDDIKTISVHHETVSGFMADVFYRVSGQPTIAITVSPATGTIASSTELIRSSPVGVMTNNSCVDSP